MKAAFMLNRIAEYFSSTKTSLMFVGLMCFIPFLVPIHLPPLANFYSEWAAAAMGLMGFWVFLNQEYWQQIKISQYSLIYLGLAAIILMQWAAGMLYSPQQSLLILSYLLFAFLLCNLAVYLKQTLGAENVTLRLAKFIVLGGIINVIFVALQVAFNAGIHIPYMPKSPTYGLISQSNHFANYMALATASLIYLYAKEQLAIKKLWLGLIAFLVLLAFSGSRSTWLYLIAFTIITFIFQQKAKKSDININEFQQVFKICLILVPLFAILQATLFYTIPDLIKLPTERLLSGEGNTSNSIRWAIWYDSWHIFLQHPWIGVGAGNIRWQSFLMLTSPTLNSTGLVFEHAHNLFLQLLTELGIIAALLTLVTIWKWIKSWWVNLNISFENCWLISILAVIGIHSMLEYPTWYTYFLGISAFLFGLGEQSFIQFKTAHRPALLRPLALIVLLLGVVNLSTMLVANIKVERWSPRGINPNFSTEMQMQFSADYFWIKNFSLMQPFAVFNMANAIEISPDNIDKKLAIIESSLHNTASFVLVEKYAALLAIKGNYKLSAKMMHLAILMEPTLKKDVLEVIPTFAAESHRQELLNLVLAELKENQLNRGNE